MKPTFDVVILTDSRYLQDSETDAYKHNVFYEDRLVSEALSSKNLNVTRRAWDDPDFDWSHTASVLFRSTWDYFDRFQEFSAWLTQITRKTVLFNSENIIRWNLDKHYLLDLKRKGIHIAETHFVEPQSSTTLNELHLRGCKDITDDGFLSLREMKNLKSVDLGRTNVGPDCLSQLREALPNCRF